MRRWALAVGCILAVVTMGTAAAQSPEPSSGPSVTRDLCLTISGPLITTVEELTARIQDGTITIDAFADGACAAQAEPSVAPAADAPLPVEVVETGFSYSGGDLHYAVILRNPNESGWVANYMAVQVGMVDGSGDLIDSASDNITLLPGQTSAIVGSVTGAKATKALEVQVANGESDWQEIDYQAGNLAISQVKVNRGEYDNSVTGRVESHFSEQVEDLQVIVVYRQGGGIIGGDYTYVDFVPANGKSSFKMYSDFERLPAGVKVDAFYAL